METSSATHRQQSLSKVIQLNIFASRLKWNSRRLDHLTGNKNYNIDAYMCILAN